MRREAIRRLESWYYAWEAAEATPAHPLVAIEELHLPGTSRTGYHIKETRRQGRSHPPIRDMGKEANRTDKIMQHIKAIDRRHFDAMTLWVKLGGLDTTAKAMRISKPTALRYFDSGIGAFQMAIICGL